MHVARERGALNAAVASFSAVRGNKQHSASCSTFSARPTKLHEYTKNMFMAIPYTLQNVVVRSATSINRGSMDELSRVRITLSIVERGDANIMHV